MSRVVEHKFHCIALDAERHALRLKNALVRYRNLEKLCVDNNLLNEIDDENDTIQTGLIFAFESLLDERTIVCEELQMYVDWYNDHGTNINDFETVKDSTIAIESYFREIRCKFLPPDLNYKTHVMKPIIPYERSWMLSGMDKSIKIETIAKRSLAKQHINAATSLIHVLTNIVSDYTDTTNIS
jgi:hypothetical protein